MSARLPGTPTVDYDNFTFARWTPERVKFCLLNWPVLEEAAHNGIERGEWPPRLGSEAAAQTHPKNVSILTTAADMHIAVRKLPKKQALAVWAYYRRGWTLREVGRYMGCSHVWAGELAARGVREVERLLCPS
jgi:DNA-directed RNA polymerase specialized sigma24 family protein